LDVYLWIYSKYIGTEIERLAFGLIAWDEEIEIYYFVYFDISSKIQFSEKRVFENLADIIESF
jgi:hypothetical protein